MEIEILGIDLAKRAFQLHGADRRGHVLHRAKVGRAALVDSVQELRPRVIAMEACSSAHHWARRFQESGVEVRLISPKYVKPFRALRQPNLRSRQRLASGGPYYPDVERCTLS